MLQKNELLTWEIGILKYILSCGSYGNNPVLIFVLWKAKKSVSCVNDHTWIKTSTLFSLVRVNLQIFMRSMDEMDQADQELRQTIGRSWPFTKRDGKLDLLVPPPVGKDQDNLIFSEYFNVTTSIDLISYFCSAKRIFLLVPKTICSL